MRYPVDKLGFPIPVWEAGIPFIEDEHENNHHMAYYARVFGQSAIANTWRNLASNQVIMPVASHTLLHQRYEGIKLPSALNMLDAIDEARDMNEQLKIYDKEEHQYNCLPISRRLMSILYCEYNKITYKKNA